MDRQWIVFLRIMACACFILAVSGLMAAPALSIGWAALGLLANKSAKKGVIKLKKRKGKSFRELYKSVRGSWGDVNPVTRVCRDRTKYTRKVKHANRREY